MAATACGIVISGTCGGVSGAVAQAVVKNKAVTHKRPRTGGQLL